jgi:hypothetical protein
MAVAVCLGSVEQRFDLLGEQIFPRSHLGISRPFQVDCPLHLRSSARVPVFRDAHHHRQRRKAGHRRGCVKSRSDVAKTFGLYARYGIDVSPGAACGVYYADLRERSDLN